MTLREHLTEAARYSADSLRDLVGPPLPPLAAAAWQVFLDLHAARPVGMQGVSPIVYTEMEAYQRLTHTRLTPWEVRLVRAIDETYLADVLSRVTTDDAPASPSTADPAS